MAGIKTFLWFSLILDKKGQEFPELCRIIQNRELLSLKVFVAFTTKS